MEQTHNTVQIRIRVHKSVKARIDALAERERRPTGNMITLLLERGLIEYKLVTARQATEVSA